MLIGNGMIFPNERRLFYMMKKNNNEKYGPNGIVNEKEFILFTEQWISLQTYAITGTSLPINEVEMRKHIGLSQNTKSPQCFKNLYDIHYQNKHLCTWWNNDLVPLILKTIHNISAYGFKCAGKGTTTGYYKALQADLETISLNSNSLTQEKAFKDFKKRCQLLHKEALQYKTTAENAEKWLNIFFEGGKDSNDNDVIGVAAIQTHFKKINAHLDNKYQNSNSKYKGLLSNMNQLKQGLVNNITGKQNFSNKKVKKMIIEMIDKINTQGENILKSKPQIMLIFQKISESWSIIRNYMSNLANASVNKLQKESDKIYLELKNSTNSWLEIATQTRNFALNLYNLKTP
ncbi:hypothetical protein [Bacillus thuringiensis]|uniref:Uncharacterized protein n=1 Tax=Bacillus thuringiensis Bt18247 TaxID=1423143 RepID=A0A9W3XBZ9_BACTU|nr:hypothetical protein [Bacillus thuringiensis]AOM14360.1 hypothetical protein BTI247_60300 [Bacillus thuringiensis Bt18247]AOM14564.1 hypothetical protein BTI247_62340 [Bacillus thuringiensis Bt18247]MBG9525848.1 hypothetical protein [Bacillus thuringiensis]MBG9525859.1 hypothetical protein [Bacillus thuringiensis]